MKTKIHLRVAKMPNGKAKVAANVKPNYSPLTDSSGHLFSTIAFAIELDIPDAMFKQASQVIATLTIPESACQVAAEVKEHIEPPEGIR